MMNRGGVTAAPFLHHQKVYTNLRKVCGTISLKETSCFAPKEDGNGRRKRLGALPRMPEQDKDKSEQKHRIEEFPSILPKMQAGKQD